MKNKSGRHKDTNTFKFQPFAERISNIDVDIFHRVGHKYEETDNELACYFHQTLVKWNVLNLTSGYTKFRKEVSDIISLPQLLHHKDRIIELLLNHLSAKDPLYLQPLLELVVALAKDLRKEFYPYYIKFLDQLIDVLNTKDTEVVEWTFQCLAYIFKFLWRYLIKDIHNVLSSLLPLLDSNKPDYVNNFAAESFAFVARKVRDRKLFLILILKLLKHKPEAVSGCGRLLFEVINGVSGQFHNCAEEILPFYLESLSDEKCSQKVLFQLLEQLIFNIAQSISPKKSTLYWTTIVNLLGKFHTQWNENHCERNAENIEFLLSLIGQSIEYKEGKMLLNSELLVDKLTSLLKDNISDTVFIKISQIGAILLLYPQINLSQECSSRLTLRILSIPSKSIVMDFIKNVITCSSFEALILPSFLEHCVIEKLNQEVLHILTRIILQKSPTRLNGFSEWKPYVIDFPVSKQIAFEYETSQILIDFLSSKLLTDQMDDVICALICVPHIKNVDKSKITDRIFSLIKDLCYKIDQNDLNKKGLFFVLTVCVDTLSHISDTSVMDSCLNVVLNTVSVYVTDYHFLTTLRILDILLSSCSKSVITKELLDKLNGILISNVSSQFHEVRLLTTHIFSLFENIQELNEIQTENDDRWKIFSICFDVESIDPNVSTYREQLKNLSHLNFDKPQTILYKDSEFKTYPLRYLLGVLYMNFKLLWKPTVEIITTQANGMVFDEFWTIFLNQLHISLKNIESTPDTTLSKFDTKCDFLSDFYTNMYSVNDKPDYNNYRLLLWNCLGDFPDLVHTKNRDVTTLFINFINNEYMISNSELAKTWNIQKNEISNKIESPTNEDAENDTEDDLETSVIKFSKKSVKTTLLSQLEVFSKMHNPKNMHREPELYQIYLELLMNRNSDVQKAALDCIMTYKHKYLVPYKENLYNLINEKQLKNELALFRIDTDSEVLIQDHRKNFIPIVLRIVYSKMIAKTGLRTGGKDGGQLKRSLILRFLSGCHEDELMQFVQMAFKFYSPFLRDDCDQIISDINTNLDLQHTIAPKKLQSTANLLNIIIEKFGAVGTKQLLPYLLRILFCIGGLIKSMFSRIDQVHAGYLKTLRQLRTSCIQIIARFFEHFETYSWSASEVNAVFDVFVWPWLDKLAIEGIHSPTALMKLFMCWSQNPRYFILLGKHLPNQSEQYAIPHIMKLFLNSKTHLSVINAILEILEHLLTLQPSEEEMMLPQIPAGEYIKADKSILERLHLKERLNFGSVMLLTHVPTILQYLQTRISEKQKHINKRELVILSRVSELVWEPETSDNLLKILLPILVKKASGAGEDTVMQMVTTLCNLIKNVPNPIRHLKAVAPLFGEISTVAPRKLLCEFLKDLTQDSTESIKIANVVVELNAWDAKWIDQPDFNKRINAFKTINSLIEQNLLECEFGVIIIHNCFYMIKYETDLSLRDNASDCLKTLAPYLAIKYANSPLKEFIINDTILSLIRNGIRDKTDKVRNESITLLGHISRECPKTYYVLTDLEMLTNKVDLEVDFFENLQHLQLHRHVRALLKFCQVSKTFTKPFSSRTLTQFILPLITHYLCSDKYLHKNTIVDAAIEAVGVVCRMLPWHQYETILRYYLGKLRFKIEYQKQLVRIIVAILDSFHFDLSRAKVESLPKIDNIDQNLEKREEDDTEEDKMITAANKEEEPQLEELLETEIPTENEIVENVLEKELTVFEKQTVLAPSAARRLIYSITSGLLPQLNRAISQMKQSEHSHKLNRKRTGAEKEEDDILRVPIALAVVKLLQKLPDKMLEQNLPGIFMKICTFLKSHLESVRRITREMLEKIMVSLGPKYLDTLLDVVTPLMTRGFQVHVLVFTVHGVLTSLKPLYKPGDLDNCLKTILELCTGDIFGVVADEKEVNNIVNKTSEAKSTKSYDTFQILGQFIVAKSLTELILPLKDILNSSFTYKKVKKAEECLRRVVLGLIDNEFILSEELLQFAYNITSDSIPELKCVEKQIFTAKEKELKSRQKEDCFIIPAAPKSRYGEVRNSVKQSVNSNAHILIEFGLRLCYFLLKRERLRELNYRELMDPFISLMLNSLKSKHVKLCTLTLNCLCWIYKMDLPSLKENIKEFAAIMFNLLHKYASAGLSKGDNFDLVMIAFKAMAVLVRDVKYFILDVDQLKTLLLYAEQDLHNHDRQATAFSLLRAIITRKFISTEIHPVMKKVAEISIIAEMAHVRLQARQVFHQFLMDYPLGKKLNKYITFYLSQLNYEINYGRQSALDMILSLIQSFPLEVLNEQSAVLFITLGARLVNDDSPDCKKSAANCITTMLLRLERKERNKLVDVVLAWLQDEDQISHRQLAAQLCGLIVTVEKTDFESRLDELIPILLLQFSPSLRFNEPGRFVRISYENDTNIADDDIQRMRDHHLFQVLQLLIKLCTACPAFLTRTEEIEDFSKYAQSFLAYSHQWVRLAAAQFIGYVMTVLKTDRIAMLYLKNKTEVGYLFSNPRDDIKSLTLDLCAQLQVDNVNEHIAEQVVKNLIFIARILKEIPLTKDNLKDEEDDDSIENSQRINLIWLIRRLRKVVFAEIAQNPSVIILRQAVFRWIGGLARMLSSEQLSSILYHLLAPLVRELATEESSTELKHLATGVSNELKRSVGNNIYTETVSKLQMKLNVKRAERKRERIQMAITDPEIAAKKKIKFQAKKKEMKKRKLADMKGKQYIKTKKRRVVDLEET